MQFKPITAITVLLLVVASLLVAGCTTNTANTTNQSPSTTPSTATHDAFLENFLAKVENNTHSSKDMVLKAWELTWINSTSARVQYAGLNKSINRTISVDATYTVFPTTQDASNYLNAMNKTEYSLASTIPTNDVYQNATGHAPQIYKNYEWGEGNTLNLAQAKLHEISQEDNLVIVLTLKILS
jgi:ABC-type uncharacterized transport system auxiliary subunit